MITIEAGKLADLQFELDKLRNHAALLPDSEQARGIEYHADNLALMLAELDPSRRVIGCDVDGWPLNAKAK